MKMDVDTVLKAFKTIGFKGYAWVEGKETRFIGTFCGHREEWEEEEEELYVWEQLKGSSGECLKKGL